MKNKLRLLVILMITCLCVGCSKSDSENQSTSTPAPSESVTGTTEPAKETDSPVATEVPAVTEEPVVTEAPEVTDAPLGTELPEITDAPEVTDTSGNAEIPTDEVSIWDVYAGFINGEVEAHIPAGTFMYQEKENYSFSEIVELRKKFVDDINPRKLSRAQFAFIDCGCDEVKELAVELLYETETDYDSDYYDYLVFKAKDGVIEYAGNVSSYYRTEGYINEFGVIIDSGSMSASSSIYNVGYIDADGIQRKVYDEMYCLATNQPIIETYYVPEAIRDEHEEKFRNFEEESYRYGFEMYNFTGESAGTTDEEYQKYLSDCYFTFYDNGIPVMPDEEYMNWINEKGLHIVSDDEINAMLEARLAECGLNEWLVGWSDPNWMGAEEFMSYIDARKQLDLIVENVDAWKLRSDEYLDNSYVYYAVVDFGEHGHPGVVRSQICYLPEQTFNKFYAVSEDGASLVEVEGVYDDERVSEIVDYYPFMIESEYDLEHLREAVAMSYDAFIEGTLGIGW